MSADTPLSKEQSDTPRTDAAIHWRQGVTGALKLVDADLARQLERELYEAKKDAARYRWVRDQHDEVEGNACFIDGMTEHFGDDLDAAIDRKIGKQS